MGTNLHEWCDGFSASVLCLGRSHVRPVGTLKAVAQAAFVFICVIRGYEVVNEPFHLIDQFLGDENFRARVSNAAQLSPRPASIIEPGRGTTRMLSKYTVSVAALLSNSNANVAKV